MSNHHIADPAALFRRFHRLGIKELEVIRREICSPEIIKEHRTWNIKESCQLIGRTAPWLRDNFPDAGGKDRRLTLDEINTIRDFAGTRYRRPTGSKALTIAVTNFKGGVGKSTEVVHLGQFLAMQGLKVLIDDKDPQASSTMNLTMVNPDIDLEDRDVPCDALIDGDYVAYRNTRRKTYFPNVDIIPSNLVMVELDARLTDAEAMEKCSDHPAHRINLALDQFRDEYDVILIDCPPNMGATCASSIIAADALIVPVPPMAYDRASFVMFTDALETLFESIQQPLEYFRILISKHPNTPIAKGVQETRLRQLYGEYVMHNCMYITTEVEKTSADMSSVYDLMKPINKRETYQRALDMMNAVNQEIFDDLKEIWESQANEQK